jgi:hypothetical protein
MADRLVLPLEPALDRKLRFSECLQSPNIVLLGDPGAGKSHRNPLVFPDQLEVEG